jgi:periplasmic divalent cation tolerance protein
MRVIFATCSPAEADGLVERLLEERLIGCANLVPGVRSHYVWKGEICRDEETVLFMETTKERVEAAMQRIRELHSYDVPKIVVLDSTDVDADYGAWLAEVVRR